MHRFYPVEIELFRFYPEVKNIRVMFYPGILFLSLGQFSNELKVYTPLYTGEFPAKAPVFPTKSSVLPSKTLVCKL